MSNRRRSWRVGASWWPDQPEQAQGGGMRHRMVAVALVAASLATGLCWSGESYGQTKIARVGILATPLIQGTPDEKAIAWYEPLRRALAHEGWVEGKNI